MTIDTRLVNARLVDSTGVRHSSLSIDGGRVIPDQETDDVWRTVDASGHLVFPGIIQPAEPAGNKALEWAKRGTTTAIVTVSIDADARPPASFDWHGAIRVSNPAEIDLASQHGARTFTPRGLPASALPDQGAPLNLRLNNESGNLQDWLNVDRATLIVGADFPSAVELAGHERVVIEIPAPLLLDENAEPLWDLINSQSRVLVTSGGDPQFPLLHFLYHEGHVKRGTPLPRIADLVSLTPAAVYGLAQKSGYDAGKDGDLVVFDPDTDDPYLDSAWPGRVIFSIQRGNILLYNGQLHTNPGHGQETGRR